MDAQQAIFDTLTWSRANLPVSELIYLYWEGSDTEVSGDALAVFADFSKVHNNRAMSTCTCDLPKYTPEERATMAAFTTAGEVISFHRKRHSATIVRNEFADLYYPGDDTPHRGTRVELSCGAAIGLPFERFGR